MMTRVKWNLGSICPGMFEPGLGIGIKNICIILAFFIPVPMENRYIYLYVPVLNSGSHNIASLLHSAAAVNHNDYLITFK